MLTPTPHMNEDADLELMERPPDETWMRPLLNGPLALFVKLLNTGTDSRIGRAVSKRRRPIVASNPRKQGNWHLQITLRYVYIFALYGVFSSSLRCGSQQRGFLGEDTRWRGDIRLNVCFSPRPSLRAGIVHITDSTPHSGVHNME